MIFKISSDQFTYLSQQLREERLDLFSHIKLTEETKKNVLLEIEEDFAIEIRDWAGEKLQLIGFDKNYDLTDQGKILEDLIDALYV